MPTTSARLYGSAINPARYKLWVAVPFKVYDLDARLNWKVSMLLRPMTQRPASALLVIVVSGSSSAADVVDAIVRTTSIYATMLLLYATLVYQQRWINYRARQMS